VAETLKVLGQIALAVANTEEQIYKAPASTAATISSIVICNRGSSEQTFIIAVDVGDDNAGASENKDFLYKDITIPGNDTFIATVGVTLAATDSVNVNGNSTSLTFSAFGIEVT